MGQLTNLYVSQSYQGLIKLANSATGVTGTLQYTQDGVGNNLPIQISTSSVNITGSFTVNGQPISVDSGSLVTTASFNAFTASIDGRVDALELETGSLQSQINQKLNTSSFNSYTSSNDSKVNSLIASTGSYATTSSLTALSQSIATTDLSQNNRLTSIEGITGSLATTSSLTSLSQSIATTDLGQDNRLGSLETATGSLQNQINQKLDTGSFNSYTSSNDGKVNDLISKTGSYATTGSNVFNGTQTISGSLNVTGEITALSASITYLETIYQTSSVIFSSGSNILGDEASDTQTLWGRVSIPTGPVSVTGSVTATNFTGSLQGTASNAVSSSQAQNAVSASQAQNANTASFALNGGVTQILAGPNIIVSPLSGQGQVTISSTGTGTGSFNTATGSYGSFYDTTTQVNPVANTPNSMSFNETAITNGVSISGSLSPFNTYIKTQNAGVYNIQFSAQLDKTDSGTDSVDIWIRKNGIDLLDTATTVTLTGNNDKSVAAWNWFVQSATNDYYQLIWASADTDLRLLAEVSSSVHPGVPSVILTANRIDQFLSNTGSFNGDFNGSFTGSLQGTASFASNALSASYAPIPSGTVSGSQQIVDLGFATTSSVNQKLDTGSFNTYTASMDARTGSYATTGSNNFIGNQTITGSVDIRSGSLELFSNNTTVNTDLYLTSSQGQSNMFFGWSDNQAPGGPLATQANYTGSLRINGSNNIVNLPQARGTNFQSSWSGYNGYISGSNNWINGNNSGIYLATGSQLLPKTQGNILGFGAAIGLSFTSSSLASPLIQNNTIYGGQINIVHNSGSAQVAVNLINTGQISSTQNFVTNTLPSISANMMLGGTIVLNHISSSINVNQNFVATPLTVNNHVSSSNIAANSVSLNNNMWLGGSLSTGPSVWVSGSQSSNNTRAISDNLVGGRSNIISSSFVSSSASNLFASLVFGQNLIVNGNNPVSTGGSAFLGRFNDTGSLSLAHDIVFAVGTGTAAATRRTGFYITSGSVTNISGSLNVNGPTIMSSSTPYVLYASGTIATQRIHFDNNPFNTNVASNLGAIRIDDLNESLNITMYDRAEISTASYVTQTVNTGSNFVRTELISQNAGLSAKLSLANFGGNGILTSNVNTEITGTLKVTAGITGSLEGTASYATNALTASFALNGGGGGSAFPFTGSAVITGSLEITGSASGNVTALSISSNTASLNLNDGNFFTLQLVSGSATHINPSNIKPGQTVNIRLNTTGSGTVNFPSSVKQVSGSSYVPTTTTGVDIITLVSFDSSSLFLANVKNLV